MYSVVSVNTVHSLANWNQKQGFLLHKYLLSCLPCIVLVNNELCLHRKLKMRMSRKSKSLPEGGGPFRRAWPSLCLSAILGMGRKIIQVKPEICPGASRSCAAARLCHRLRETASKASEVLLCPLSETVPHHSPPRE